MRRIVTLAIVAIFLIIFGIVTYFNQSQITEEGFGIYLLDNNELVISDTDIISYNRTSHEIRLNEGGVKKIKTLHLYQKPFAIKLDGKQVYNGAFWSDISSIPYSVIVIVDILTVQYGMTDSIRIEKGYPSSEFFEGVDPRNNSEIFDYFQKVGKLTQ